MIFIDHAASIVDHDLGKRTDEKLSRNLIGSADPGVEFVQFAVAPAGTEARKRGAERSAFNVEELERVAGIEPAYSAWKAAALPLSYTRNCRYR